MLIGVLSDSGWTVSKGLNDDVCNSPHGEGRSTTRSPKCRKRSGERNKRKAKERTGKPTRSGNKGGDTHDRRLKSVYNGVL